MKTNFAPTENQPGFADSYYAAARQYHENGQKREAHIAFKNCLEATPEHYAAQIGLAYVSEDFGDLKGAREEVEKAIALNPAGYEGYIIRARIGFEQKDYRGAQRDLETAIALNKRHGDNEIIPVQWDAIGKVLDYLGNLTGSVDGPFLKA